MFAEWRKYNSETVIPKNVLFGLQNNEIIIHNGYISNVPGYIFSAQAIYVHKLVRNHLTSSLSESNGIYTSGKYDFCEKGTKRSFY